MRYGFDGENSYRSSIEIDIGDQLEGMKLIGIIGYWGMSTDPGHYTCLLWNESLNCWLNSNDEHVFKLDTIHPRYEGRAYVLLYKSTEGDIKEKESTDKLHNVDVNNNAEVAKVHPKEQRLYNNDENNAGKVVAYHLNSAGIELGMDVCTAEQLTETSNESKTTQSDKDLVDLLSEDLNKITITANKKQEDKPTQDRKFSGASWSRYQCLL